MRGRTRLFSNTLEFSKPLSSKTLTLFQAPQQQNPLSVRQAIAQADPHPDPSSSSSSESSTDDDDDDDDVNSVTDQGG
jgi:hypothetical protein